MNLCNVNGKVPDLKRHHPTQQGNNRADVARFLCLCLGEGGGGGQCRTQKSFPSRVVARKFIGLLGACSPGKFSKYRAQDWLKNACPEILAWKN